MATNNAAFRNVVRLLKNWKGAGAGVEEPPEVLAEQIGAIYEQRLAMRPASTRSIRER